MMLTNCRFHAALSARLVLSTVSMAAMYGQRMCNCCLLMLQPGARSPSMIGQGRIGELISAKPRARRALLEEAAGISGLHSRRHEAELRLRAAETNLERLDDVIGQLDSQLDSLKRQARQANRYRAVSGDIRKTEGLLFYLRLKVANEAVGEAEAALAAATFDVGKKAEAQAQSAKQQAIIAHQLPALRDAEAKAAAALQRLTLARNQIDQEAQRIEGRRTELDQRLGQLNEDVTRERQMIVENSDILAHLNKEEELLQGETAKSDERESDAGNALDTTRIRLEASEASLAEITSETAMVSAARNQLQRTINDSTERQQRLAEQITSVATDLENISTEIAKTAGADEKQLRIDRLEKLVAHADTETIEAEKRVAASRVEEEEARAPAQLHDLN